MAEVKNYQELLEQTVHLIGESEENYKGFLRASAWNFKYGLVDRILIFAQKPEAIACAEASVWESEKVNRVVKKDAFAIGVMRNQDVIHLYDVGDTVSKKESEIPFSLWEYKEAVEEQVLHLFQEVEPDVFDGITKLSDGILLLMEDRLKGIEPYYLEDLYVLEEIAPEERERYALQVHEFVCSAVYFMITERMGQPFDANLQFSEKHSIFKTEEGFLMGLAIASAGSEEVLREMSAILKRVLPKPELEKTKREDYYGHHPIQEIRQIYGAGLTDGREDGLWEVRADEVRLSQRTPTGSVRLLPDEGDALESSSGSGQSGERDDRGTDEEVKEDPSGAGSERHAGVDGVHESVEADGGGSDVSDSDLRFEVSCERRLSEEEIEFILTNDEFLTHNNEELSAVLSDDTADFDVKKAYLMEAYDEYFCSILYPHDENVEYVGYKKQEDGLYMWEGNFLSRTADSFASWEDILRFRMGKLGIPFDKEILNPEEETEKRGSQGEPMRQEDFLKEDREVEHEEKIATEESEQHENTMTEADVVTYVDTQGKLRLREDIFLKELRRGSQVADGKYRIYRYFNEEHSAKEKADFLKAEYGIGARTFRAGEYTSEGHDAKGISFSSYSGDAEAILYTWAQVAEIVEEEVKKGTYLTEQEMAHFPIYENEQRIRVLGLAVHRHFKTYFPLDYITRMEQTIPGFSYFFDDFGEAVDLLSTYAGKQFLVAALKGFESGIPEEATARKALLSEMEKVWAVYGKREPGLTRLEKELGEKDSGDAAPQLRVKVNDVVHIGGKQYVICEITDDEVVIQDEAFPLFTDPYSKQDFLKILKEDWRNQGFIAEGTTLETGYEMHERFYRLLSYLALPVVSGEKPYMRLSKEGKMEFSFCVTGEDSMLFSLLDSGKENVLFSISISLNREERRAVPSSFSIDGGLSEEELLDVVSSEMQKVQLSQFFYQMLSGVCKDGYGAELNAQPFAWEQTGSFETFEKEQALEEETHLENDIDKENDIASSLAEREAYGESHVDVIEVSAPETEISTEVLNHEPLQYHIVPEGFVFGGEKERFRENVKAIRLLKEIEKEGRFATAEEQEILFRYVGWGGLSYAFDEKVPSWKKEYEELKELLTEEEYASARESTLTAFYTPPEVIAGIYQILSNLGFENGNILDPACGTGNFFGMLPEGMEGSNLYGVELDSVSGRIAKQLYQKSSIAIEGFEKTKLPDQFFDAVVGNVPFGQFGVLDDAYKKQNFMIHDYFFAKALDKVRPGGIVAFITSKGTMDKKDPEVREYIAKRADLLGAIRLPNNTFSQNAGTTVTSDLLILQKRDRMRTELPSWTKVSEDKNGFAINSYFIEHPEMVLGKLSMVRGQAGRWDVACLPEIQVPFEERFSEAIAKIQGEYRSYDYEEEEREENDGSIPADMDVQNFGFTLIDNVVYQRRDSRMYPVETNGMALKRIQGLIPIRETLRALIQVQLDNGSDAQVATYQKELNILYDAFVEEFGLINSRGNSLAFSDDPSYYLLCSLEQMDEDEHFLGKADIFTKRTVRTKKNVKEAEDSMDALALSIGELGRVDLDYMNSLLPNQTKEEIIGDLTGVIFRDPLDRDTFLPADEYLSGDVKEKLRIAKEAANENPAYQVNVEALLTVQPKPLDASEISVRLGTTWIPDDVITEFFWDLFDIQESYRDKDSWGYNHVVYSPATDSWAVEGYDHFSYGVLFTSTYGTSRRNGKQIFEDVLNLKESKVIDYYEEDGVRKSKVNKEETILAQEKQERIKDAFQEWVWKDMGRRERLVNLYNEKFNSMRPREYNGDYLLFHGMNPEITLRKHQVDAIARGIYGGNTLLDHPVGAGKTWEMTAIAMEGKRLGLSHKNLFVVPNHLLKQWASDFLTLYPAANLLVATEKDFTPANRKKFCARIATGEWDAVIIGHSQFERIPMSEEFQERILRDQIVEISSEIARVKEEKGNHVTIKQLEHSKKSLEKNLNKFHDKKRRDDVITFEELGVDRIFIDEFHFYKNLWFYTKMQNIAGVSPTGAQKTSDLFMKVQYLNELTDYKGLVGATGTPITNSMAELYSLQRYFAPQVLEKLGISSFDAWASTFGEVVTSVELAPEGTNYRTKQRFAKFYNLPELIMLYHDFADVKTPDMLNLPVPKANFENVCVEASEEQLFLLKELSKRADAVRDGMVDPTEDNMLNITNDGRKLALDQRLLDEHLSDNSDSKVNACVDNIFTIWEKHQEEKLTQLVFCDLSTPTGKKKETIVMEEKDGRAEMVGFEIPFDNVYEDMKRKLIQKGIPEEEIAFIHDANTTKRKEQLFANVRSGKVRVLMGSTSKMGVGTNVQDLVVALHDLDCPWRPSDLEQRLGRGIRQGNQNEEVDVFRYVTESTFDAYSYQLVEQKQRFISQVRNGSLSVRSAEDIDDSSLAFSELKALAAGNPLIKEKMDLDIQVHKLNLLKTEYQRNLFRMEEDVAKHYPARIAKSKLYLKRIQEDIETFGQYKGEVFSILLGNMTYTDRKEAGKALEEMLKEEKHMDRTTIGSFYGFSVAVSYSELFGRHTLYLVGNNSYELGDAYVKGSKNLELLEQKLLKLPEDLENGKRYLTRTEQDLARAEIEITKEFAHEEELRAKNKRLTELNILLNVEGGAGKEALLRDAKSAETSPELLTKLRGHVEAEIREAVAGNPSVLLEDLLVLKDDPNQNVQLSAYANEKMPEEELRRFCKDAGEGMISQMLERVEATEGVLSVILEGLDSHSNLAYKLAKYKPMTPTLLDTLARKGNKYLYRDILGRKDILPETVEFIGEVTEKDWIYSREVLKHPKCSEERMLSCCDDILNQEYILTNPNVTNRVLEKLAECGSWSVKRQAKEMLEERQQEKECETAGNGLTLDEKLQEVKRELRGDSERKEVGEILR